MLYVYRQDGICIRTHFVKAAGQHSSGGEATGEKGEFQPHKPRYWSHSFVSHRSAPICDLTESSRNLLVNIELCTRCSLLLDHILLHTLKGV